MARRLNARVVRAGEQLMVVLPSRTVRAIGLQAGDVVELTTGDGAIIIRRALSLSELVRLITPKNRHDEICWRTTKREAW
jgi:antitoxin component of MazEF toxin-antitoxin module